VSIQQPQQTHFRGGHSPQTVGPARAPGPGPVPGLKPVTPSLLFQQAQAGNPSPPLGPVFSPALVPRRVHHS
jgi:hypothetical protein